jgi:hypothetical protein
MSRLLFTILVGTILGITIGCGGKVTTATASIRGIVKVDGAVVDAGTIQFVPSSPTVGAGVSAEIQQGAYSANNVPLGAVKVVIVALKDTGKMDTSYSVPTPIRKNVTPEKYRGGIPGDIKGDDSNMNFDLKSK